MNWMQVLFIDRSGETIFLLKIIKWTYKPKRGKKKKKSKKGFHVFFLNSQEKNPLDVYVQ
jgi:hypothetical protein